MTEALKHSTEPPDIKELAKKKVTGLIGSIRQKRRLEQEGRAAKESQALRQSGQPYTNIPPGHHSSINRQGVPRQTNGGDVGKENMVEGSYGFPPSYR